MSITISENKIVFDVPNGCIDCPFSSNTGRGCGCDKEVSTTHDYTYPSNCPLLTKTIEVKRIA